MNCFGIYIKSFKEIIIKCIVKVMKNIIGGVKNIIWGKGNRGLKIIYG